MLPPKLQDGLRLTEALPPIVKEPSTSSTLSVSDEERVSQHMSQYSVSQHMSQYSVSQHMSQYLHPDMEMFEDYYKNYDSDDSADIRPIRKSSCPPSIN